MKNSFRLLTVLCLGAALSTSVLAAPTDGKMGDGMRMGGRMGEGGKIGGRRGGGMRGGSMGRMGRMTQELGLTDAQKAKMKGIMEAQRPQMMALRDDTKLSREQKMTKMRAMNAAQMKKIVAILTPAQRQKMQDSMRERRGQMKPGV